MSNPDFLRLGSFRALAPEGGEKDEARPLAAIEKLLQPKPRPRPGEKCEMCAVDVPDEHSHIVNLESRSLLCACRPCYLLFTSGGAGGGRYRAVPDRYVSMEACALSPAQWDDAADPGEHRLLLLQLRGRAAGGVLPEPRRRHRVPPAGRDVGRDDRGQPRPHHHGARHRGPPGAGGRPVGARRVLHRADRRLLRAGGLPPPPVAGLRRRHRGSPGHGRLLHSGARSGSKPAPTSQQ